MWEWVSDARAQFVREKSHEYRAKEPLMGMAKEPWIVNDKRTKTSESKRSRWWRGPKSLRALSCSCVVFYWRWTWRRKQTKYDHPNLTLWHAQRSATVSRDETPFRIMPTKKGKKNGVSQTAFSNRANCFLCHTPKTFLILCKIVSKTKVFFDNGILWTVIVLPKSPMPVIGF